MSSLPFSYFSFNVQSFPGPRDEYYFWKSDRKSSTIVGCTLLSVLLLFIYALYGDDGYWLVAKRVIDSGRYNIVGGSAWST